MFDRDHSGTIELQEFQGLWNYLTQWRTLFDQFDRDRSGTIDVGELNTGFCLAHCSCDVMHCFSLCFNSHFHIALFSTKKKHLQCFQICSL